MIVRYSTVPVLSRTDIIATYVENKNGIGKSFFTRCFNEATRVSLPYLLKYVKHIRISTYVSKYILWKIKLCQVTVCYFLLFRYRAYVITGTSTYSCRYGRRTDQEL